MDRRHDAIANHLTAGKGKAVKNILAVQLLGAARVVVIEHKGECYELRLTRNGKLILTKQVGSEPANGAPAPVVASQEHFGVLLEKELPMRATHLLSALALAGAAGYLDLHRAGNY